MRPRILTALLAACLMLALVTMSGAAAVRVPSASASPPPDVLVHAVEQTYNPSMPTVGRGATVVWDWPGMQNHTATDGTGMGLYDSHAVAPGGPTFSYTFVAAGIYAVTCTLHSEIGMVGHIKVPMRVAPKSGAHTRTFTASWASVEAPPGFVYDVQVQREGREWKLWKDGVTERRGGYQPKKKGTYLFRARMRKLASSSASGWSEQASITAR